MSDYINELQRLAGIWNTATAGSPLRRARDISGGNPFDLGGMALDWARDTLGRAGGGQEHPDFFGGGMSGMTGYSAPAYVQPKYDMGQMPSYNAPPDVNRPQIQNYLARLLGAR